MIQRSRRAGHRTRAARLRMAGLSLLLAPFIAPPALAGETVSIPFELTASGHPAAEISLGDVDTSRAVLDTGANFAMFDEAILTSAGIELPSERREVRVLGLTGVQTFPSLVVPRVGLDGLHLSALPAVHYRPADRPWPANVLPLSAFEGRTAEFDFEAGTFRVYDSAPRRRADEFSSHLALTSRQGVWFARIRLNGRTGWALIDTGSNVTYVNSAMARQRAPRRRAESEVIMKGSTEGEALARTLRVRRLHLGRHRLSGFEILVADPPVFEHFGFADEPAMVLGIDVLRHFRVQIDRKRERLILGRPADNRFRR